MHLAIQKSRYSVWPSAYASGALVKCRKVGAANWGNSRKEEVEYEVNEMVGKAVGKAVGKLIKQGVRKAGQAGGSIKPKKGFYNVKSGPNTKTTFSLKGDEIVSKSVRPEGGGSRRVKASYGKKPEKSLTQSMKDKLAAQTGKKPTKPPYTYGQTPTEIKTRANKFPGTYAYKPQGAGLEGDFKIAKKPETTITQTSDADKAARRERVREMEKKNQGREIKFSRQKKELSYEEGFSPMQIAALESAGLIEIKEGQKCWKGYEKKGTKMMFGKRYNNCVKKKATKEEVEYTNEGVAFLKREKEKKKI